MADLDTELSAFLQPFLDKLGHKKRRQMCPLYLSGLIGPGDRKSIEPMAERFAPGQYDRLHHFISDGLGMQRLLRLNSRDRRTGSLVHPMHFW